MTLTNDPQTALTEEQMSPTSKVPAEELDRLRKRRNAWRVAWTDRADTPLTELLIGLEESLDAATEMAGVTGKAEAGYPKLKVMVEVPTKPDDVERPLELIQSLTWNEDIIERSIEGLVVECRRRAYSWADIATALGVARQSAWTKYAALEGDQEPTV